MTSITIYTTRKSLLAEDAVEKTLLHFNADSECYANAAEAEYIDQLCICDTLYSILDNIAEYYTSNNYGRVILLNEAESDKLLILLEEAAEKLSIDVRAVLLIEVDQIMSLSEMYKTIKQLQPNQILIQYN